MIPIAAGSSSLELPPSRQNGNQQESKIGFRFTFVYFLLYVAPGPIGSRSSYQTIESLQGNSWIRLCHAAVTWVGTTFLHLPTNDLREIPNGSGDQLYDYVLILCLIIAAAFVTLIWSGLDRRARTMKGCIGGCVS